MTTIIPSRIHLREANDDSFKIDCLTGDRDGRRIHRTNVRGGINCGTNCGHSGDLFQTFYALGIDRRCVWSPRQGAVCRISVRRGSDRANSTFRTKIRGTVDILLRNTRFAPCSCVADAGRLVPATGKSYRGDNVPRIHHHGRTLRLAETRILVASGRYRSICISALSPTSGIATREEHDGGEENQRLCHQSTNLSNTIVARKRLKCKSYRNRQATACVSLMSYNILHGEMSRDLAGENTSRVSLSPTSMTSCVRAKTEFLTIQSKETACP